MNLPIHSKDPRKPKIVHELKLASGARKVTSVRQVGPGIYEGACLFPLPGSRLSSRKVFRVVMAEEAEVASITEVGGSRREPCNCDACRVGDGH